MKRKSKKKYLIFLIILISIGFAYLTTTLQINGQSKLKPQEFDVHFDNLRSVETGLELAQDDVPAEISQDGKSINYHITYNEPGEIYGFMVDIVNEGTLHASLESIVQSELSPELSNYINTFILYTSGKQITKGDILLAGDKTSIIFFSEYNNSLDSFPEQQIDFSITTTINYKQINTRDIKTTTFKTGREMSYQMSTMAEGTFGEDGSNEIRGFVRADDPIDNIEDDGWLASTDDSEYPIYIWYDDTDDENIIYWYTEADVVYMNEDSSGFFAYYEFAEDEEEEDTFSFFTGLRDIDSLADINTSKVENMALMFGQCVSLKDVESISNWDTSNVTNMSYMFLGIRDLTTSDLEFWDTSNVTDLSYTFAFSGINDTEGLNNWNVEQVQSMDYLFVECNNLTDISDLAVWQTLSLETMEGIFANTGITDLQPLTDWCVDNVINMKYAFIQSSIINLIGLQQWNVEKVIDMSYMFGDCEDLVMIDPIQGWKPLNVANMAYMFAGDPITTIPLAAWNVQRVIYMDGMFAECQYLDDVEPISHWTLLSIQSMQMMFVNTTSLQSAQILNRWNILQSVNIDHMFSGSGVETTQSYPSWYH